MGKTILALISDIIFVQKRNEFQSMMELFGKKKKDLKANNPSASKKVTFAEETSTLVGSKSTLDGSKSGSWGSNKSKSKPIARAKGGRKELTAAEKRMMLGQLGTWQAKKMIN